MSRKFSQIKNDYPMVEIQEQHLLTYEKFYFNEKDGVYKSIGALSKSAPNIEAANNAGWFVKKPDVAKMELIERKMLSDIIDDKYMEFVTYDPSG